MTRSEKITICDIGLYLAICFFIFVHKENKCIPASEIDAHIAKQFNPDYPPQPQKGNTP